LVISYLPANNQGGSTTSITLNVNGKVAGKYEMTKDVLRTLYENNGSIDGLQVSVARSA
jgi:hypothetical protein